MFALVKENLWDGTGERSTGTRYICYQLDELCEKHKISKSERTRCKRIVSKLLGVHGLLEIWLYYKHGVKTGGTSLYDLKIQATRRAWLDHLIEHYKAQGK